MKIKPKKVLVTGTAGFIGFHIAKYFLNNDWYVLGYDAVTNYYDIELKKKRNQILLENKNFNFTEGYLENEKLLRDTISNFKPEIVVHLAAQAGVRYSIENPKAYLDSNIIGTFNLLEILKDKNIKHFLMASTSSVYGGNKNLPFDELQKTDNQISFYAATKKTNEIMTHYYSHMYNLPVTMFRFFTVYGPWGRPDMALFKFTKNIIENKAIDIFNFGKMTRDFTYIDDLVEAVSLLISQPPKMNSDTQKNTDSISIVAPWRIVNIGNNNPVELLDYILAIENELGIKAKKNMLPMQPGDVSSTYSNIDLLSDLTGFRPKTNIKLGIKKFINWYKSYYER